MKEADGWFSALIPILAGLHDGVTQQRRVVPSCLPAPPPLPPPRARARVMSQLQPGTHGEGPMQWPNTEYITSFSCISIYCHVAESRVCDKIQTKIRAVNRALPCPAPAIRQRAAAVTTCRPADYTQTQTDKTQRTRNTIAHYYTLDRGINIIIP